MKMQSVKQSVFAMIVTVCASVSWSMADHFRHVPLDEGVGHTHYRIVDGTGATLLVVRARAEYSSVEIRAKDIADRLNRALDNLHEHGNLYLEVEWRHGIPIIHQVSRDGMVHSMVVAVSPGDVLGARRREGVGDAVDLARAWLDRIEAAVDSALQAEEPEAVEPGSEGTTMPREPNAPSLHGTRLPGSAEQGEDAETDEPRPGDSTGPEELPAPGQPAPDTKVSTGIRLRLDPADAAIYVDETPSPSAGTAPIPVSPGRHTIEVVRPGFLPFRQHVEVRLGRIVDLNIRLEPEGVEPR